MTAISEVSQSGRIDKMEEIFTCLRLPGVIYDFLISKEEPLDGKWIYRIYQFDNVSWRRIEEYEFTRIRALMEDSHRTLVSGNAISAQSKLNKLLKMWTRYWDKQAPHGVNPIRGRVEPR